MRQGNDLRPCIGGIKVVQGDVLHHLLLLVHIALRRDTISRLPIQHAIASSASRCTTAAWAWKSSNINNMMACAEGGRRFDVA